jgi:hypothetical protein
MVLIDLSTMLSQTKYGYIITEKNEKHKSSHLTMYFLKICTTNSHEVRVTEAVSTDNQMKFGINKHRANSVEKGKQISLSLSLTKKQ